MCTTEHYNLDLLWNNTYTQRLHVYTKITEIILCRNLSSWRVKWKLHETACRHNIDKLTSVIFVYHWTIEMLIHCIFNSYSSSCIIEHIVLTQVYIVTLLCSQGSSHRLCCGPNIAAAITVTHIGAESRLCILIPRWCMCGQNCITQATIAKEKNTRQPSVVCAFLLLMEWLVSVRKHIGWDGDWTWLSYSYSFCFDHCC